MILDSVNSPSDLKTLSLAECDELAGEIRDFVVEATSRTGGHLGSNLGIVELTLALHRVFDSRATCCCSTPATRPMSTSS